MRLGINETEPYFKDTLSYSEKLDYNKYHGKTLRYIKKLKETGKYNKNYKAETSKIYEMVNFGNRQIISQTFLQVILFSDKTEEFLKEVKKFGVTEEILRNILDTCAINSLLRIYTLIELSFKAILKGVEYKFRGKKSKVNGAETLGQIQKIMNGILPHENFFWDEMDIGFRNAIAHGRYLVKNYKFTYYKDSDFKNPVEMTFDQFASKSRRLSMMAIIIGGVIGEWITMEKFGVSEECSKYYIK